MTTAKPSGNQIAFFILATWLLVVPLTRWLIKVLNLDPLEREIFERYFHGLLVGAAFLAVPVLRRACAELLHARIPRPRREEVALVALLSPLHNFAFAGAFVLWISMSEGPLGLQQSLSGLDSASHASAYALQPWVVITHFGIAVGLGPIMEELLFRGFLYRAWFERYGWVVAMMLTAILFGALHPNFLSAFFASILFTCVYRRTGSLWSAIVVHATTNALCYYLFLGQFVFPRDLEYPGDLQTWKWHIAAFFGFTAALAVYGWMSRDRTSPAYEVEDQHVALPR